MLLEIIFIVLGILIFLWLTISVFTVIVTLIGSPADMHDILIDDTKGNDAAKSKKLR